MAFRFSNESIAVEYFDRLRRQAIVDINIDGCDVSVPDELDTDLYPCTWQHFMELK